MKKYRAVLPAILLMILPLVSLAEPIDFSVYTLEELLQMQAALDQAVTDKMRETVSTPASDFIWPITAWRSCCAATRAPLQTS